MVQRLKTAPVVHGADAAELPDLSGKEQEFVRQLLMGKTGADAYRAAYDTSNMLPNTVIAEASRLRGTHSISAWLVAARKAHLGTAVLTKEAHLAELDRLKEIALESGNIGAAVQAEQLRGKVAGHQVERIQELPADPIQTLRDIAQHQPDLAASLAAQHGIPWQADQGATKH